MSAPDRPTREQVDTAATERAAALLLAAARVDPTLRAAAEQVQDALIARDAEVRALRAEQATERALLGRADDALRALSKAAIVVAPTLRKPYPDAPDTSPWERFVQTPARAAYALASEIRTVLIGHARAPLPAVPDGEDVADLRDQLDRAHALNRKQHRELVELTMVPPLPYGEDVPARLDAAAEALEADGLSLGPVMFRRLAAITRTTGPDVRAAVAAALARPTEREQ